MKVSRVVNSTGQSLYMVSNSHLMEEWKSKSRNLDIIANSCRVNILLQIQNAGSGHIGTSFSSIEILVALAESFGSTFSFSSQSDQPIFFSSKGHDAPAIYAVMHSLGIFSDSQLLTFRKFDGLPGHPEIDTVGVPTNTGSLGMGISKAKGFVHAARARGEKRRVVVLLGDGELQEGQIWESLGSAARDRMSELTVIIDGNGIQSDKWVNETLPLGDLRMRFEGAGWNFFECDGHNITALRKTFRDIQFSDGPTVILAKTVKGKGVRLFEEFPPSGNFYKFHSGAIPHEIYLMAIQEVAMIEIADSNKELGYWVDSEKPRSRSENLIDVWGHLLNEKMQSDPAVYVLDADLSYDTGTSYIREEFSSRYIQCGIAEQDMVSMAGGLALGGIFPIVHSFASFLTMRAAEQIFNNTTERSRILYVGFLAGLIPSAPGFSHQAVNDVSIMCSMPGMKVLEASNPRELKECMALASAYSGPTYLRVVSISLTGDSPLDPLGRFYWRAGQGADILIISSGVTMSLEILQCFSRESNLHSKYQFITGIDLSTELSEEEAEFLLKFKKVVVVENYLRGHGLFQVLLSNRSIREQIELVRIGIDGLPRSGENEKVLKHHGLDSESILGQIYPPK